MLYHLLSLLREHYSVLNLFRYQTFRAIVAFLLAFLIVLIVQPWFIRWVKFRQFGQPIRDDGPESHKVKQGTPTMGGLVVVLSILLVALLFCDLSSILVWLMIIVTAGYGVLGFVDDYKKVSQNNSYKGLSARGKLYWQFGIAFFALLILFVANPQFSTVVTVPFTKDWGVDLGWFYLLFAALVIVGTSNAVNLTDGLDGLMIGPVMSTAFAYGIFAYAAGREDYAAYLGISHVAGSGELAVIAAAIIAAGLAFLWYNSFPASVFMWDDGALALGGALGTLAVITKHELVLILAGGIFVIEALSVMIQVFWFKMTGKRVFRMAPIHHHFELGGLVEPKIIVRCWIVSIILAIISIASLKIR